MGGAPGSATAPDSARGGVIGGSPARRDRPPQPKPRVEPKERIRTTRFSNAGLPSQPTAKRASPASASPRSVAAAALRGELMAELKTRLSSRFTAIYSE